jgi:hypothetical protein
MLKGVTTFLVFLGICLFGGFFWVLADHPKQGDRLAMEKYSVLLGAYLIVTVLCFASAAFCAILLVRRVREEYQAQSRENLEMLVETAMYSHKKKTDAEQQ